MSNLSTLALFAIFLFSAAVVLLSGRPLANTTATLSRRYGLGQALGGMLILAVVTDLPELAIIVSASIRGDLSLAVGNVLGGTVAQLMVLVALDRAHAGGPSLATRASSTALKVECLLVILLLSVVIAGPSLVAIGNLGPFTIPDLLTPLLWIAGLLWIAKLRPCNAGDGKQVLASNGDKQALLIFMISALVTFVGGVGLEVVGDALADRFHMGGVLFGATILAAATSLPELATGWSSAKAGENELAVSDIMGGNAVLPVLLTPATLIAGTTAYKSIDGTSIYLCAVGIVMTAIYLFALVLRSHKRWLGLGPESLLMTAVYIIAMAVMSAIISCCSL